MHSGWIKHQERSAPASGGSSEGQTTQEVAGSALDKAFLINGKVDGGGVFLWFCQVGCWVVGVVGGLVFEHGEDEVAASAGEADYGGVVVFAF